MKQLIPCLFLLPLIFSPDVMAASSELADNPVTQPRSKLLETGTDAIAIERRPPKFPRAEAQARKEGWVMLSYIVEADGSVSHPLVEDSSGVRGFEKAAMKSITEWKFTPATQNGEATQACHNTVRFDFNLRSKTKGASRQFIRQYRKIKTLLDEGQLDEAKDALAVLKKRPKWNLYEDAWYWLLSARYFKDSGQPKQQLKSLQRASSSQRHVPEDAYLVTLQSMFVLQIQANHFQDALATFERIEKAKGGEKVVTLLQPYQQKVKDLLAGPEDLVIAGEIGNNDFWHYRLSRKQFTFAQISGKLDKLDVRCDRKRQTFSYGEGESWTIPASWGECRVYVYGEENTTFKLLELPLGTVSS